MDICCGLQFAPSQILSNNNNLSFIWYLYQGDWWPIDSTPLEGILKYEEKTRHNKNQRSWLNCGNLMWDGLPGWGRFNQFSSGADKRQVVWVLNCNCNSLKNYIYIFFIINVTIDWLRFVCIFEVHFNPPSK